MSHDSDDDRGRDGKSGGMFRKRRLPSPVGGIEYIDYKDVELLSKLLTIQGKIQPRKRLGADAKMQHRIKKAIHRARFMALVPYGG
ncbi:MAG: 30S ribosomal protein S18 [Planctomycetota bacterium]